MLYHSNNHLSPYSETWNEKYVWNNIRSIRSQVIYFWTDMNVKYTFFSYVLRNSLPFISTSIKMMKKNLIAFFSLPFSRCWWQTHSTFFFCWYYKIPFDAHLISKPFLMEKYRGYAMCKGMFSSISFCHF